MGQSQVLLYYRVFVFYLKYKIWHDNTSWIWPPFPYKNVTNIHAYFPLSHNTQNTEKLKQVAMRREQAKQSAVEAKEAVTKQKDDNYIVASMLREQVGGLCNMLLCFIMCVIGRI